MVHPFLVVLSFIGQTNYHRCLRQIPDLKSHETPKNVVFITLQYILHYTVILNVVHLGKDFSSEIVKVLVK